MRTASARVGLPGYGIAFLAVVFALLASHATWELSKSLPWVFCFAAVIVTAWFGGQRPGFVATVGLALSGRYFFMKPYRTLSLSQDNFVLILVFLSVSLFISYLVAARRRAEDYEHAERRRFQATVASIGDAVIATDAEGGVTFLNGVAEELTGWTLSEAKDRRLEDIFVIVQEETRETRPNPVKKVLETGQIQRFANQTILIARDRSERFIDDCAAPIVDGGRITGVVLVFHDTTEKRRAERALAKSEERFRLTADNAPVLIWLAATDKLCYWFNKPWLEFTGRTMEQERGCGWDEGVYPDDRGRCLEIYRSSFEARTAFKMDYRLRHHDGQYRWIVNNGIPLYDHDGGFTGFIGSCVDIQDRVAAEEELREHDRQKDEFLAMLAHELRNPLSAVGNAVTLLKMSNDPDNVGFAKEIISRQMQHLTRLIDDLLDVSRISRGKIELRKEVVEATPILDSAVESVKPLINERKHTLGVFLERGKLWMDADPTRLEQIVINLLNNAAKYSENAGHIRLSACIEEREVVITIKDKGIGIQPEKLPQMFELFTQGDRSLARSEGGLGIGLTVVRRLVEMHGGTVTARSEGIGKGSEFTIRLPAVDEQMRVRSLPLSPVEQTNRRSRILVVDDNVDTARGMSRLLNLLGHDIVTAHNGPDAIEAAREHRPEFVLLDIGLPGMDGYEVAARLRQEECCKSTMIVAVTGYGREEDQRRSREAGFDFHLIKPVDHDALVGLLFAAQNGQNQSG